MPEINPLTNNQIFLKKIAENTGSNYETGDVSEINPLTIDQIFLKEIAANTAGQSGDITELEEKVTATQDIISDAYDSTHTYNVGDYCIYENVLYKCNTASTTGTWDSSKWDAVTVAVELGELTERVDAGSIYHNLSSSTWNSGDTITIPLPDKARRGMLVSIAGNYPLNVSSLYYVGGGSQGYRVEALSENGTTLTYDGTNNALIATKTSANADAVDVAVISISGIAG